MKKRKALSSKKSKKEKEDKKGSNTKKIKYKSTALSKVLESIESIDESHHNEKYGF